jgi:GNAT superfamily N-acetyltransferase
MRNPVRADSTWIVTSGAQSPETVSRLLGLLPAWFGIESSNAHYVEAGAELPTYLAWPEPDPDSRPDGAGGHAGAGDRPDAAGEPAGVLLAARHFPGAAEIYLMAVDPALHRRGVGRALVEALERDLVADHVWLLQVKTLGPSHPDPGYARTRMFYEGMGFAPLEETLDLWPGNPCLIMVKVLA